MARDPFLLLGCESGHLRFAALTGQGGGPVPELRQPTSLRLLPYRGEGAMYAHCLPAHALWSVFGHPAPSPLKGKRP